MKKRTKYDSMYNKLISIQDDDLFLAAITAMDGKDIFFMHDERYLPLQKRVATLSAARREQYGTKEDKERHALLLQMVTKIAETGLRGPQLAKAAQRFVAIFQHKINKKRNDKNRN